jgi:hypothetical protein
MKRTGLSTLMAITFGCALAAQTPTDPQTDQSRQSGNRQGQVTVVGCLQSGDAAHGATGTSGTPTTGTTPTETAASGSRSAAGGSFILTNAKMSTGASSGTGTTASGTTSGTTGSATSGTGTSGSATTSPSSSPRSAAMGTSYKLTGGTNLAQHVGHQIEVTGTLSPSGATSGTTSGTTPPPTTGSAGSTGMSHAAQTLNVASVRMISASCQAQ